MKWLVPLTIALMILMLVGVFRLCEDFAARERKKIDVAQAIVDLIDPPEVHARRPKAAPTPKAQPFLYQPGHYDDPAPWSKQP